ncbi:MAG: hypothetical protein NVV73_01765 [Cellvibrionaceae bacterium]|nr:hypothetical protein [Cellvibrionaceae bacterium]
MPNASCDALNSEPPLEDELDELELELAVPPDDVPPDEVPSGESPPQALSAKVNSMEYIILCIANPRPRFQRAEISK